MGERTDIKLLLDPTSSANEWSTKHSTTNTLFLPSRKGLSRICVRAAVSLPKLILGTQDSIPTPLPAENPSSTMPVIVSKYDNVGAFCNAFHHRELERIRSNLTIGPDVVTSEIFSLRDTDLHSTQGTVDGVAKEPALSFFCEKLVDFLSRYRYHTSLNWHIY